eukprot:s2587_g5.t1
MLLLARGLFVFRLADRFSSKERARGRLWYSSPVLACPLQDDVTSKLGDIIKVNNMLKTQVENGAGEHIIADFVKLLQYHIFTLCDNTIVGIPQACTKSKRPLKQS